MAKSPIDPTRSVRARHLKSRNGCLTCRIRRIRCDETLPFCHNCQSTGRQCEGPKQEKFTFVTGRRPSSRRQSPNRASSSPEESSLRICTPALTANHTSNECRAFDFFVRRAAPLFAAGTVNSAFWENLVPQISHSDTVVWDAAIAIATLMEHPIGKTHVVYRAGTVKATKPQQLQALKWYSRAVLGIKQRMDDGNAMVLALLTCILFTCIEIQQGNTNNVRNLVQHGVKLFADYLKNRPHRYRILDEVVIPFISQHAITFATCALPPLSQAAQAAQLTPPATLAEQPEGSTSPEELKLQLYRLMYLGHELNRGAALIIEDPQELQLFKTAQTSILAELQQWRARFDSSRKTCPASRTDRALSSLLIHYYITYIWVSISLSSEEVTTDQYTDQFRELVSHAERYLFLRPVEEADSSLVEFGAEFIPPLYLTVTKCRHPGVRRRALSLIDHLPKGDTIWATLPVVAILETLIAFEEKNDTAQELRNRFPAEEDRVHHVQVVKPAGALNLAAKFVTFTKDGEGRRKLKEHVVALDDWKKMPRNETQSRVPARTHLRGDSDPIFLKLVKSPEFFGTMSPTPAETSAAIHRVVIEGVM